MKKILSVALALIMGFSAFAQFESAKNIAPKGGAKTMPTWHQIQQDVTGVNFLDPTETISTAAIRNAGKCMVIDYSATWCSWCWVMHTNGILEAIHNQLGNQIEVIWVESDPSTTNPAEITGSGSTQGDWTNGGTVPYPIINDEAFNNLIGNSNITGYPTVVFVSPTGYWCDVYGTDWGFGPYDATEAVNAVSALLNQYPQAGVPPVVDIDGPTSVINGNQVTFTANIVSVDDVTGISWSIPGATVTSGTNNTITTSFTTDGDYTVELTVTNTVGTTTKTLNVHVFSWNWGNTMSYCEGYQASSGYRTGSSSTWGVMFPAQFMTGREYLKNVDIYVVGGATYQMKIYQGSNNGNPGTQIYSRNVQFTAADEGWQTINCAGSVALDQTKDLWVVFTVATSSLYPMSVIYDANGDMYYVGDPNSCWAMVQGSWYQMSAIDYPCTFAIKATTGNTPNADINTLDGGQVNIYPNPTTGMVNIDVDALESVEVMDMAGRVVMTSNQSNIDMSALANGVYMFRVNTATGSTMQKVVKR